MVCNEKGGHTLFARILERVHVRGRIDRILVQETCRIYVQRGTSRPFVQEPHKLTRTAGAAFISSEGRYQST